jgi:hypothetical protein
MAVWYLDNDDEITDAVARLRGTSDERVVFVVPPGSRIATGRINFKLLAREAETRELRMAIASPDDQVRALATSAGVLVAATPAEAEAALERGDEPPDAGETEYTDPASHPTEVVATPSKGKQGRGVSLSWRSQRIRIATVAVLVLAVVGLYAASQTLPSAEVTLSPRLSALGPLEVLVTAMPSVTETDIEGGRIAALEIEIPLTIDGTFPAGGTETVETRATGEVVFSSPEQLTDQDIEAGTRLQTPGGVDFQTTEAVTLPRSSGIPSQVVAPVEAIDSGEQSNVSAEAISVAPSLEGQPITVSNPEATSGGRFEQTPLVTTNDYDVATVDLKNRLVGARDAHLRDPANTPEGMTLFTETAQLGAVTYSPSPEDLVGLSAADFTLGGSATARVLAVDEALVDELIRARLSLAVLDGHALLDESISVEHGEGSAAGDRIHFNGSASGDVFPLVDTDDVLGQIAGLPVSDAQAILEEIGAATVSVWPEFLGDLPNDRDRITLEVLEPSTTE